MQLYNIFYRARGIRRVNQIVSPPLSFVKDWEIPRASVLHYLTENVATGPDANYPFLKGAERGTWVDHLTALTTTEGNPRYVPSGAMHEIREYSAHNPLMRWLRNRPYTTLTDARYPLVINYDLLRTLYVYRTNIWARWYEWQNRFTTLCSRITKTSEIERQQFWVIELPTEVPSIVKFQHAEVKHDTTTSRMFHNGVLITLLDLWKWAGEHREDSLLSTVPVLALEKLNVVFTRNGQFTVINLGLLNSWRESDEDDDTPSVAMESFFTEMNDDISLEDGHTGVQLDPLKLQKRLLRLWLTLGDANVDADIIGDDEFAELNAAGLTPRSKQTADDVESDADAQFRDPVDVDPDAAEDATDPDDTDHQGGRTVIDEDDSHTDALLQTHSETTSTAPVGTVDLDSVEPYQAPVYAPEANVIRKAKEALAQGSISLAEYQRLQMLSERYRTMDAPGTDVPLAEFVKIPPEALTIPKDVTLAPTAGLVDASMNQSSLTVFDTQYIDKVLDRDVMGMIVGFQQSGVAVTKLHAEDFQDISNHYRVYTVELTPVTGKQSTLKVKVPVVQADGTVLSGGVRYYLKKQRSEVPIRKTSPTRVALTSYYGKTFIDRAESVVVNYDHWLANQVTILGLSRDASTVTEMRVGEVFDSTTRTPRVYSALGKRFTSFTAAGIPLSFNYNRRVELYGDQSKLEQQFDGVVVGRHESMPVLMRQDNSLVRSDGTHTTELGTIETLLGLPASKRPVEMATMSIFSESIPLGIVLGYKLGFSTLLRTLNVKPRRVENGRQLNMNDNEYRIRFKDCSLIFDRTDVKATLIISGLNARHRSVVKYDLAQFDKPDVYLNIIEDYGLTIRYTREIDNLYDMFIDPITRELLLDMKEPTDMVLLILRGAELLTTDYHNEEEGTRYKGYERIAGTVYKQLMLAYRQKQTRPFANRLGIEMNPEAVWMACMMDTAMEVSDDINPIHNLKQKEIVTFGGTGGRSAKTMVKRTRQYRNSDVGVISEATVDSGDVGVITYLSADPKFNSIRGTFDTYDFATEGKTRLLSSSSLLAPAIDTDDSKRANFCSIQNSHSVPCDSYITLPLSTGYEDVLAHRTDALYATTAKQAGTVSALTSSGIVVTNADGSVVAIELGKRYGKTKGSTVPHTLVTDLKLGDTIVAGQPIAWNTNFFTKSKLSGNLRYKAGVLAATALMDGADTYEDSSAISEAFATQMVSRITYTRYLVLNFDQRINNLVSEGQLVGADGILCTIQDSVTAGAGLFDDDTLSTLQSLADATPKAKHEGVIDRLDVIYNGNIADMDESLQAVAIPSDRRRTRTTNTLGQPRLTGQVDGTYRIEGTPLQPNQLAIVVYITTGVGMGVGDKLVFGNQLKSIIGRVMTGVNRTKSGVPIDAIFSYASVSNRICVSPEVMGTTNTLLRLISKQAAHIYKGI